MSVEAMQSAVKAVGTQTALAKILQCTPQNVQRMCATGKVTAKHVLKIEAATGVPRFLLNPDLYPDERLPLNKTVMSHQDKRQIVGSAVCLSSEKATPE